MIGIGRIISNLSEMRRASKYRKLGAGALLAMEDDSFYDAIECMCTDAVEYDIDGETVSEEQRNVYTLICLEREVNNGGLCQFFTNSSSNCAPYVSGALEAVGAGDIREAYDDFVSKNNIDVHDLSQFEIESIEEFEQNYEKYDFDAFDDKFYEEDRFTDCLLDYARRNIEKMMAE